MPAPCSSLGCAVPTGLSRSLAEAVYERTLCVDGEETTLLVMDTWEPEQPPGIPRCQRGRVSWDIQDIVRARPQLRGL